MIFGFKIKELQIRPENQKNWLLFLEQNDGRDIDISVTFRTKQRTGKQNAALHVWCTEMANGLNAAGLGQREVLKPTTFIEWSLTSVKDKLWRPLQIALFGKESTTQLEKTGEIDKILDTIRVIFAENPRLAGFEVPKWPEEKKDDTKVEYPVQDNKTAF